MPRRRAQGSRRRGNAQAPLGVCEPEEPTQTRPFAGQTDRHPEQKCSAALTAKRPPTEAPGPVRRPDSFVSKSYARGPDAQRPQHRAGRGRRRVRWVGGVAFGRGDERWLGPVCGRNRAPSPLERITAPLNIARVSEDHYVAHRQANPGMFDIPPCIRDVFG